MAGNGLSLLLSIETKEYEWPFNNKESVLRPQYIL